MERATLKGTFTVADGGSLLIQFYSILISAKTKLITPKNKQKF